MTDAETLKAAQEVISTPSRWTQMRFAEDARGEHIEPCDDRARKWCAAGAILCVSEMPTGEAAYLGRVFDYLARVADPDNLCNDVDEMIAVIGGVNDRAGHKDQRPDLAFKAVHQMYDQAIELAEAS